MSASSTGSSATGLCLVLTLGGSIAAQGYFSRSALSSFSEVQVADEAASNITYLPIGLKRHNGTFYQRKTPTTTNTPTVWHTPTAETLTPTPSPTLSRLNISEPPMDVYSGCVVREERHETDTSDITRVVVTTFNKLGRPTSIEQDMIDMKPDGKFDDVTIYKYKNLWQPIERLRYELGADVKLLLQSVYSYNTFDQLTQVTTEIPGTQPSLVTFEYDTYGRMVRQVAGRDIETRDYSERNELIRRTRSFGDGLGVSVTIYDWVDGLVVVEREDSDGDGVFEGVYQYKHDILRRLVYQESPLGRYTYSYNDRGWLEVLDLERHANEHLITTLIYDESGRRSRVDFDDPGNGSSFIVYENVCP